MLPTKPSDSHFAEQHHTYSWAAEVLWIRRWRIVKCAVLGMIVFTCLAFTIPKRYQSTVQLMPPDPRLVSMASLLSPSTAAATGAASNLLGLRSPNAVFFGILRSRTALDDIINRFDLMSVYHLRTYDATRKKLLSLTTLNEDKISQNLRITVTDNDPRRARDIAAAYIDELNKLVAAGSTSSARTERIFLEQQLASLKTHLDSDARDLAAFSSRNATFDAPTQVKAMLDSVAQMQGNLAAAQSELSAARTVYSEDNVHVRSLNARVEELQKEIRQASGQSDALSAKLAPNQLYPSVRQLPLLGETYADLYRRAQIDESLYELLTKQYELAKVEEAKEIPTVKVLDPPNFPEKKSFPPRLLIMILGFILSLMAGVVWVYGQEWYNSDSGLHLKQALRRVRIDVHADFNRIVHRPGEDADRNLVLPPQSER